MSLLPKMPPLPVPEKVYVPGVGMIDAETLKIMVPLPVLTMPIDPAVLCRAVQSSATMGQFDAPIYRFAAVIPAGVTLRFSLSARIGFVGVMISPMQLYASLHDARMVINLWVDGVNRVTPDGVPMTADMSISMAQYWLVYTGVTVEVVNGSPFDIMLTLDSQAGVVEKTLFDKFYLPMLNYSYQSMFRMAGLIGGANSV